MIRLKKVLVVDDHELIVKGISDILNSNFDIEKIYAFTDPTLVEDAIKESDFDLYFLDMEFKDMTGFDLIRIVRKVHPNAKIVIITMHDEVWNINQMVEMDVDGIVLKSDAIENLHRAVLQILTDSKYYSPEIRQLQRKRTANTDSNRLNYPTQSELLILRHIAEGYSSREIAEKLALSENTIEGHRKNLFLKLEAKNVAHLVSLALRYNLIKQ